MEEEKEMKLMEKEEKRKKREGEELKKAKEANRAEKKRKAATQKGKCSNKIKKTDDVTTTTTSRMETQTTYRCTYCEAASDDELDDVAFFAACEQGIL